MSKTTGHALLTFRNYSLENKLLQELVDESLKLFQILFNQKSVLLLNSSGTISPFIKFIWDDQHQLEFVTIIVQKSTTVYHLH